MKKFKEFVKHAADNNQLRYIGYAYLLHPQETKEVLMMAGKIPIPEENVKFIVEDLTPERILRHINLEDIPEENVKSFVEDFTPERILRYINAEDRLSGIDSETLQKLPDILLKSFKREDLKKFLELLNDKINGDEQ